MIPAGQFVQQVINKSHDADSLITIYSGVKKSLFDQILKEPCTFGCEVPFLFIQKAKGFGCELPHSEI